MPYTQETIFARENTPDMVAVRQHGYDYILGSDTVLSVESTQLRRWDIYGSLSDFSRCLCDYNLSHLLGLFYEALDDFFVKLQNHEGKGFRYLYSQVQGHRVPHIAKT